MLNSPSLAVSFFPASSAASSFLAAPSSVAVLLPQPASIDTVNVAANRIDKLFSSYPLSFSSFIDKQELLHYPCKNSSFPRVTYCSKRWHATQCSFSYSLNLGTSCLHLSVAYGQRVWKRQPLGGFIGDGISPSNTIRCRFLLTCGSGTGTAESKVSYMDVTDYGSTHNFLQALPLFQDT